MCDVIIFQVQLLWAAQSADEDERLVNKLRFFINSLIKPVCV